MDQTPGVQEATKIAVSHEPLSVLNKDRVWKLPESQVKMPLRAAAVIQNQTEISSPPKLSPIREYEGVDQKTDKLLLIRDPGGKVVIEVTSPSKSEKKVAGVFNIRPTAPATEYYVRLPDAQWPQNPNTIDLNSNLQPLILLQVTPEAASRLISEENWMIAPTNELQQHPSIKDKLTWREQQPSAPVPETSPQPPEFGPFDLGPLGNVRVTEANLQWTCPTQTLYDLEQAGKIIGQRVEKGSAFFTINPEEHLDPTQRNKENLIKKTQATLTALQNLSHGQPVSFRGPDFNYNTDSQPSISKSPIEDQAVYTIAAALDRGKGTDFQLSDSETDIQRRISVKPIIIEREGATLHLAINDRIAIERQMVPSPLNAEVKIPIPMAHRIVSLEYLTDAQIAKLEQSPKKFK